MNSAQPIILLFLCCGLTQQLATMHQTAARLPLPFPSPGGMQRRNVQKGKLVD